MIFDVFDALPEPEFLLGAALVMFALGGLTAIIWMLRKALQHEEKR